MQTALLSHKDDVTEAARGVCLSVLYTFVLKFKIQKEIDMIKFSWRVVHDEQLNNLLSCQNCKKKNFLNRITMVVFIIKDTTQSLFLWSKCWKSVWSVSNNEC